MLGPLQLGIPVGECRTPSRRAPAARGRARPYPAYSNPYCDLLQRTPSGERILIEALTGVERVP